MKFRSIRRNLLLANPVNKELPHPVLPSFPVWVGFLYGLLIP